MPRGSAIILISQMARRMQSNPFIPFLKAITYNFLEYFLSFKLDDNFFLLLCTQLVGGDNSVCCYNYVKKKGIKVITESIRIIGCIITLIN